MKGVNDDVRQWFGEAYLMGGVGVVANSYPILVNMGTPDKEGAQLAFDAPELIPGPLQSQLVRQRVAISLSAPPSRAEEAARVALLEVADVAAFGARRPVRIVLSSLANAPLDRPEQITETIVSMESVRQVERPTPIDVTYVLNVWRAIVPLGDENERKVVRALRWLRAAAAAEDDVEEFSALAFSAEALGPMLPAPSAEWLKSVRQSGDASEPATSSEKLRHFATETLKVPGNDWRGAWRKRNELCHGGLSESADEQAKLRKAVTVLRPTLLAGLKAVLNIPESALPSTATRAPVPNVQIIFSQHVPFMKPTE